MAIKETVFTLDLTREGRHPVVKFRLNDNKVQKITFRLTNNGREIDLEREMGDQFKPVFECIFRDKTFKRDEDQRNWEIKRDTTGKYPLYTFTYYLTDEVINKSGIACYYFALETPEGLRISTPTLKMVIDCDFKEDGKPSDNYVSEFEKLLKEANRVKQTIEDLDETLKEVIAGGASITEVIEAREDKSGNIFPKLKDRLNNIETISWATDKEVKDARIGSDGTNYRTLSERINSENQKTNSAIEKTRKESTDNVFKETLRVGETEIIGHRGLSFSAPENTMISFKMATNNGFDSWECDIQMSSDGIPFVIHDDTVDRTTNGTGNVSSLTSNQLSELDASKTKPYYDGARIPTFEEFVKGSIGNSLRIYPELKGVKEDNDIKKCIDIVKKYRREQTTVFCCLHPHILDKVREFNSDITLGYLANNRSEFDFVIEYAKKHQKCIMLLERMIVMNDPKVVQTCHELGLDVGVWTTDSSFEIKSLRSLGISKFMTNKVLGAL